MTTNPPPVGGAGQLGRRAVLKLWMWLRKGRYMSPTRIWPPTPMTIPTASIGGSARPRSKDELPGAAHPAGQPRPGEEADPQPDQARPTYHSGGAESLAMALSWLPSPARSAAMAAKTKPTISPAKKPRSPKNSQNQPSPRVSGGCARHVEEGPLAPALRARRCLAHRGQAGAARRPRSPRARSGAGGGSVSAFARRAVAGLGHLRHVSWAPHVRWRRLRGAVRGGGVGA